MKEMKENDNFNNSGFNDDSIYSEEENKRKSKNICNFLMKSHNSDSFNKIKKTDSNSINDNINSKIKVSNIIDIDNNNDNNDNNDINLIYNNNIISNPLKDSNNSINSEDEENAKNKNNNNTENGLSTNLIIPSDDNIIFSFKNKLSNLSSTDDIFRDTVKISMNRANKFNTSKLARIFTYEENGKSDNYILKSQKFGMSKNNNIITYILNLYIFSEFTNFSKIEKDLRVNLYFLPITKNRFIPNVDFLNKIKIKNDKSDQYIAFINGLNELLNDKEYNEIQKNNKKYAICLYISIIISFLLISSIIFYFLLFFEVFSFEIFNNFICAQGDKVKYLITISAGIIALILIILMIILLIKIKKKKIIYNL